MRKALVALVATVTLALAGVLVASPKTTNNANLASPVSGLDVFSLTQRARDLPTQSYPAH